ncbi:hypothetical protein JZO72_12280 [Vagococcus fluvialis]|uniref:hypothetical protein n=1 Tax=Vagococcus fluvialis TaxID=2738 RepID=UPI001A8D7B16|nr:hypothetical protein [Vagococcus fluvialis]MBO0480413.1 hypothetical protein [Vagococcus fluvialis]MBO0484267.1 hypothetical protein [Vagococcus fluvialis]UDM71343.1 hypothetical protein K5L00_00665 [Vagococcus fluvialis]UDM76205.1 hypothetical protein K5K98_10470 [Vagococcus fluvialis]UDM83034.1 hypothetical protein K5K96_03140 [Vagococcus fluvialis]
MKKKLSMFFVALLLLPLFLIPVTASADTFYEGSGVNRSKCTLRNTYSSNDLKKMGNAYKNNANSIAALGIVAGLTPVLGKFLAAGTASIVLHANMTGSGLIDKGNAGYKGKEYYCEKVNWDGYSRRSYTKIKFTK